MNNVWFPCYTGDLLGSLTWKCMKPAQRGGYWQLICWQMQSDDGHLPADVDALSGLSDLDLSAAENAIVLKAFPLDVTGAYRANKRALEIWRERHKRAEKTTEDAKHAAAKRWHAKTDAPAMRRQCARNAPAMPEQCPSDAHSHSQSQPNSRTHPKPRIPGDARGDAREDGDNSESAAKPRERNMILDALSRADGGPDGITKPGWARIAKALSDIRTAAPDVTPEEIGRRIENYRTHYPDCACTSTAVAKHWAICAEKKSAPSVHRGMQEHIEPKMLF